MSLQLCLQRRRFADRWLIGGGALGNNVCKGGRAAEKGEVEWQCSCCNRGRSQSGGRSCDGPSEMGQWDLHPVGTGCGLLLGSWNYLGQGSLLLLQITYSLEVVLGLCFCVGFSLVAAGGGYALIASVGFSCWRAQVSGAPAQQLWSLGFVAPRHVGSLWTRDRTRVSCIGGFLTTEPPGKPKAAFFFKGGVLGRTLNPWPSEGTSALILQV